MEKGKVGLPRPLVKDGQGPLGLDRPFVDTKSRKLIKRLNDAIENENQDDIDYHNIIILLREKGHDEMAEVVEDIRKQEMRHENAFKNVLNRVWRKLKRKSEK